ncbi:MAG: LppX_LprAFG lipoprotein [Acidimicrobiia bacterium]
MKGRMIAAFVVLAAVAASCSSAEDTTTTAPPTAAELLATSAATMGSVDTVQFSIERGGEPVYIDAQGFLEFVSATGRFAAPGAAEALVTVSALGLSTEVGAVVIEGETWLTNPITGNWEPTPPGYTFDPATLFDPEVGFRAMLQEGIPSVEDVGDELVEEETLRHVRFTASGARVEVITAGMVRGEDVTIDAWIEPASGQLRRATFSTRIGAAPTEWDLTFFDYGADISITPPDLEG